MSVSTGIGVVSESLVAMLSELMVADPPATVTALDPDGQAGGRHVNLFLYRIGENPYLRNLDWQPQPGTGRLVAPPLSLTLAYMLTAYAPADQQVAVGAAHQLLGDAMRVFHDNPVMPSRFLLEGLAHAREEIRIVHTPVTLEEATQLWNALAQPYRTSAFYEVSVLQIDSTTTVPQPPRVRTTVVREPDPAHQPPVVDAMQHTGGRLGFTGQHLRGCTATVVTAGRTLASGITLDGDAFSVALPADLAPGLYEVRVEVSGLFHRMFPVELP